MSENPQAVVVTDVGMIRSNNEDLAYAGQRLYVIADGMGGPPAGDLASEIMIGTLRSLDEDAVDTGYDAMVTLRDRVDDANRAIFEAAEEDAGRQGMGTTVTGLLRAEDGTLGMVHVGDSRGYLFRSGELTQITIDDTYVQLLIDQGALDPADARHHPQRAIVTQAVQGASFEPHCSVLEPEPGDRYLLCSDGLSDVITDETIATALGAYPDPLDCGQRLIKLTLASGAPDNVTVVLVDIPD
ncbi:MAG TPA: protein phosphatase 2C domain-containing protein [Micromonosporaceae bacterium]